jgi:F0F1-type ATP synthase membrane subunit b/b'
VRRIAGELERAEKERTAARDHLVRLEAELAELERAGEPWD